MRFRTRRVFALSVALFLATALLGAQQRRELGALLEIFQPDRLPIVLDERDAFAEPDASTLDKLSGFDPRAVTLTVSDLEAPLEAGDLQIQVWAFCMKASVHAPGFGVGYKLARPSGKAAPAIAALFLDGSIAQADRILLQDTSWILQSGIAPDDMPAANRQAVRDFIPRENAKALEGDLLDKYEKMAKPATLIGKLPRFGVRLPVVETFDLDRLLLETGDVGRVIQRVRTERKILRDQQLSFEAREQRLFEAGGHSGSRILTPNTPEPPRWGEIYPGVFARFTVVQYNMGVNTLDLRITSQAVNAAVAAGERLTLLRILYGVASLHPALALPLRAGLIAYSIEQAAQALMISPVVSSEDSPTRPFIGPVERQTEYKQAKYYCDEQKPTPSDDECSTLSAEIDHAERCISLYEAWDEKWIPGRHDDNRLLTWRIRLQNKKDEHKRKCTTKSR